MDIFYDWKFYLFVIAIINIIVTLVSFLTIKFNDLRHLDEDVKDIAKDIKAIDKKVIKIDKTQAVQEQKIKELEKTKK